MLDVKYTGGYIIKITIVQIKLLMTSINYYHEEITIRSNTVILIDATQTVKCDCSVTEHNNQCKSPNVCSKGKLLIKEST